MQQRAKDKVQKCVH